MELKAFLDAVAHSRARLVHLYFGHMAMHWLPLLRACQVPVVVSFHGADAGVEMEHPVRQSMMAEVFARSARILARSRALLDDLARLGCPPGKLALNRTGIPLDEFPSIPRTVPQDDRWILLQSGRLIPKKGYHTTLEAMAEILKHFPRAMLRVAGEGPESQALRRQADQLGISASVEWLGFLKPPALREALREAHMFLHPSETGPDGNREGVPNGMLEAMATGLPVVATRHGGIPEAVTHGASGLLVEEGDGPGLASAVLGLLADPARLDLLGKNAASSVATEFSQPAAIAALEAIYADATA